MYTYLFVLAACNFIYFALHIGNTASFPKPLCKKDEEKYLELVAQGDEHAKCVLVEHNLRLVAHIIKKYYSSYKDQEDLISIGTIGLIKAVSSYSLDKNTRFSSFASKCIENEILMHFRKKKKTMYDVFISDPIDVDKDGNSLTLMDIMADEENIVDIIDLSIKTHKLYELLDKLFDERDKGIIIMRYGLYGTIPKTQREVAEHYHISRSYVSRIEKKALEKLRLHFESEI